MAHNDAGPAMENSWREWSKYVLKSLEDLQLQNEKAITQIEEIKLEMAVLKLKSSFWGAVSGIATTIVILGVEYIRRKP